MLSKKDSMDLGPDKPYIYEIRFSNPNPQQPIEANIVLTRGAGFAKGDPTMRRTKKLCFLGRTTAKARELPSPRKDQRLAKGVAVCSHAELLP